MRISLSIASTCAELPSCRRAGSVALATWTQQLGEALGQEFVRRTFTENQAGTFRMTEQIEKAMAQEINGLTG